MDVSPYADSKGVRTAVEAAALQAVQTSLRNAHVVTPFLTRRQTEDLLELFGGVQLRFEPTKVWGHPVQRVVHNFLEQYVCKRAGPGALKLVRTLVASTSAKAAHRCFLPAVGRDAQRWNTAPRRGLANYIRRAMANGVKSTREFCQLGFTVCDHPAEVGLALYSLQDVDPADVVCAMAKHKMNTLFAVLHLPHEALLPSGNYVSRYYRVVSAGGNLIVTYNDDTSAGYVHNRKNILKWVEVTSVRGRHSAVFERVRSVGCHFVIQITLTDPCSMPYTPYTTIDTLYVRNVFGPALKSSLFGPKCCSDAKFVPVPRDIWQRLMMFGTTLDDEAFCCSRLMTYLRGISNKVVVGNVVANRGWRAEDEQLTTVIIAAYLTICHQRWVRTQGIAKGIKRLQAEHAQTFWFRVWEFFTNRPGTVPGYSVDFYRMLASWISGGLIIDVQGKVFDLRLRCGCCCLPNSRDSDWGILDTNGDEVEEFPHKCKEWHIRPVAAGTSVNAKQVVVRASSEEDLIVLDHTPTGVVVPSLRELAARAIGFKSLAKPPELMAPTPGVVQRPAVVAATRDASICAANQLPSPAEPDPNRPPINPGRPNLSARVLLILPDGARIIVGDLFNSAAKWLVNAANKNHRPGGGVCGQFYRRWPQLWPVWGTSIRTSSGDVYFQRADRWVIHAPAPDARVQPVTTEELIEVYAATAEREGNAAYPVLGSGIFGCDFMASVCAWLSTRRPEDELYIHPSDLDRYNPQMLPPGLLGAGPPKTVEISPGAAEIANLGLTTEPDPYCRYTRGIQVQPGPITYRFIAGVPGSGKSTSVDHTDAVVVAPTRTLVDGWVARGAVAYTPHKALSKVAGRRVIFDEAPSVPKHLLLALIQPAAEVLLLGDPNQIPAIDFDDRMISQAIDTIFEPTEWRNITHRCPQDVCRYISADYPGITTTSTVVRSVMFDGPIVGQKIVFTQAAKAANPGSVTVHEAQGCTYDRVTLIATMDARGLIATSRAHAIVALTRHTKVCRVVDEGGALVDVGVTDAMFLSIEMQLVHVRPALPARIERAHPPDPDGTPVFTAVQTDVTARLTAEVIGHQPLELAAVNPQCPPLEQGLLFMPERLDGKDEIVVMRLSDTVHCRVAAPTSRLAIINTLVGRYGRETKLSEESYSVREVLAQYIPCLKPCPPTTVEYMELVQAMEDKGQTGALVLELTDDSKARFRISFFQKDCAKYTLDEPLCHGKVGQGISAWPKTLCHLFGPWFRSIEKQIVQNLPPGVFYGDLYVESELHAAVMCVPPDVQVFENDFSEFDSTQNNVSLDLETLLLTEAGMPKWMVELYRLVRQYWTLTAPKEALRGCWKKHSGEPGTLLWNTVWNMAAVSYVYDFERRYVACFKGDDSVVLAGEVLPRPGGQSLIAGCGLKMKDKVGRIGVYSNLIVAPGVGVVKDVLRYWARLTEKNFGPTEERMLELRDAAADFVQQVRYEGKEMLMVELCAAYYGTTRGFMEVTWQGILAVAEGRAGLNTYRMPVLNIEGGDK
ncbi:non-structural polyprotein [Paslahepevirus balayani]|uniref:Non-structural polyprotein n=1 Tax=little egret hepatitis E virus TaxID=3070744 RepID=A0AA47YVB3_9VIRU|nr:non-structural polyprotein [Paslahepevirus balayani]APA34844.1 non-structural polyprotein [little egret hepatitis E virus]